MSWLRRVPKRTKAHGATGFGSGSKRFDPAIKIIDWALKLPQPGAPFAAEESDADDAEPNIASQRRDSLGMHAPQSFSERNDVLLGGQVAEFSDRERSAPGASPGSAGISRMRTPWAAMSYDGVHRGAEHHRVTRADLAALQLHGEVQYTPVTRMSGRRHLESGGLTGWGTGKSQQRQRELPSMPHAAERPGPAHTARGAVKPSEADNTFPGYIREVRVSRDKFNISSVRSPSAVAATKIIPVSCTSDLGPDTPTSLTDCFNEGNFIPLYDLVTIDGNSSHDANLMWSSFATLPVQRLEQVA